MIQLPSRRYWGSVPPEPISKEKSFFLPKRKRKKKGRRKGNKKGKRKEKWGRRVLELWNYKVRVADILHVPSSSTVHQDLDRLNSAAPLIQDTGTCFQKTLQTSNLHQSILFKSSQFYLVNHCRKKKIQNHSNDTVVCGWKIWENPKVIFLSLLKLMFKYFHCLKSLHMNILLHTSRFQSPKCLLKYL